MWPKLSCWVFSQQTNTLPGVLLPFFRSAVFGAHSFQGFALPAPWCCWDGSRPGQSHGRELSYRTGSSHCGGVLTGAVGAGHTWATALWLCRRAGTLLVPVPRQLCLVPSWYSTRQGFTRRAASPFASQHWGNCYGTAEKITSGLVRLFWRNKFHSLGSLYPSLAWCPPAQLRVHAQTQSKCYSRYPSAEKLHCNFLFSTFLPLPQGSCATS